MIIFNTTHHLLMTSRNPTIWVGVWRQRDYYGSITCVCFLTWGLVYEHARKVSDHDIKRRQFCLAWWRRL
jgi:hypothetical protein